MWSDTGLKIDLDNLLTSPQKPVQTSSAPSMNQMAQASPSHPHPPTSSPSSTFTAGPNYNVNTAGPNYNVNTASLMGSGMPPRPQPRMAMGMAGGMGMGMGMAGGVGMGMAGGMGMGYGGYGAQPGMMPMYGVVGQPGMGYGVMPSSVGGNQPMGAQQKLM